LDLLFFAALVPGVSSSLPSPSVFFYLIIASVQLSLKGKWIQSNTTVHNGGNISIVLISLWKLCRYRYVSVTMNSSKRIRFYSRPILVWFLNICIESTNAKTKQCFLFLKRTKWFSIPHNNFYISPLTWFIR
jgi:hypothetical protein